MRLPGTLATALLVLGLSGIDDVAAEHFDILLRVRSAQGAAESPWDTAPPEGGLNRRQSVAAKAGEELTLEWRVRSEFPHGVMKDVTTRIYVVPIEAAGQRKLPPEGTPCVVDNRFTSTFRPHHAARGRFRFRVSKPGAYLVRLESRGTLHEHGHEHFGAVDVVVE